MSIKVQTTNLLPSMAYNEEIGCQITADSLFIFERNGEEHTLTLKTDSLSRQHIHLFFPNKFSTGNLLLKVCCFDSQEVELSIRGKSFLWCSFPKRHLGIYQHFLKIYGYELTDNLDQALVEGKNLVDIPKTKHIAVIRPILQERFLNR